MSHGIRLQFETLRSLDGTTITDDYAVIQTPFEHPIRLIMVDNLTDALLFFSFDGINDHFIVNQLSSKILDVSSNRVDDGGYFIAKNIGLFVSVADPAEIPTTGEVYLSVAYAAGD